MTVTAEARLINRRCRCGKLLAEPSAGCHWHETGSAHYARDLLRYIEIKRHSRRSLWTRLATFLNELKGTQGEPMRTYLFEYIVDGHTRVHPVHAIDSMDAFNIFRADHPFAPISDIHVQETR